MIAPAGASLPDYPLYGHDASGEIGRAGAGWKSVLPTISPKTTIWTPLASGS